MFRHSLRALAAAAHERRLRAQSRAHRGVSMEPLSHHEEKLLHRCFKRLAPERLVPDFNGDGTSGRFRSTYLDFLEAIGAAGGPSDPAEDERLQSAYKRILIAVREGRFSFSQFRRSLVAEGDKYAVSSPFHDIFFQTAGYAGSSRTLSLMHGEMGLSGPLSDSPIRGYLRFCNDTHSTIAVRSRNERSVAIAMNELRLVRARGGGRPFAVASYASGSGVFASALFLAAQCAGEDRVACTLVDVDPRATVYACYRSYREHFSRSAHFYCLNLLSSKSFDLDRLGIRDSFDYAECQGLFDYLPSELSTRDISRGRSVPAFGIVLSKLFASVRPGGLLVVGNFATGHPNEAFMELGNWPLLLRDEVSLEQLAERYAGLDHARGDSVSFERTVPGTTQILMRLRKGA